MDDKGINVLMVGGRRAGKSSMLAGLFEVMLGDDIKKLVTVEDVTQGQHESLTGKIQELREELRNKSGKVVMDDKTPTDKFHPYTLKVSLPDSGHSTKITFTDVNGEYYTNIIKDDAQKYEENRQQLVETVRKSDVILIAIDTPFLMEGREAQNLRANCVVEIQGLLTELKKEDKAKLVVFVPIKCEKWAQGGHRIEEVTERVEKVYDTHIKNLNSPMVEILILPVQTVGSMRFREFLPAYLYNTGRQSQPCSLIDDYTKLRFADGNTKVVDEADSEKIVEDSRSVFLGTNIERPNAWYEVTSAQYAPKNCEQLAYHILRYTLHRTTDAIEVQNEQRRKNGKGIWKWVLIAAAIATGTFWLYAAAAAAFLLGDKLGDISTEELDALVNKLSTEGYIKDSGDGIKIVQKYQRITTNK